MWGHTAERAEHILCSLCSPQQRFSCDTYSASRGPDTVTNHNLAYVREILLRVNIKSWSRQYSWLCVKTCHNQLGDVITDIFNISLSQKRHLFPPALKQPSSFKCLKSLLCLVWMTTAPCRPESTAIFLCYVEIQGWIAILMYFSIQIWNISVVRSNQAPSHAVCL